MDIGYQIINLRVNVYKETQREFAKRCGICKTCLGQIERGAVIKPTRKVIRKLETALGIDFYKTNDTNGTYVFKNSQKQERFKNVLNCVCREINKQIDELNFLTNEELYLRDDEYFDEQLNQIYTNLEVMKKNIKSTDTRTKEEKAYDFIDEVFDKQGGNVSTFKGKSHDTTD